MAQDRKSTFQVLNIPANAPLMAMGGKNISWGGAETGQFLSNPALSADSMDHYAGFNYIAFSGAFNMASANYHHSIGRGNLTSALRHISLGDMQGYDPSGNATEPFSAGQSALTLGYQLSQGNFSYGATIDFISIGIAGYNSNAITLSAGGLFVHPEQALTIGASIKHIGFILSGFTQEDELNVPWDVQMGITYKPEHMPIRFSLTGYHLFNRDLLDDNISSSSAREILAHLVVGTEIVLSKNISFMAGYNHLLRQELKLQQTAGSAGFSYGFLWRTNTVQFAYGRGAYHVAGASHVLTLNINLNKIFRKI